MEHIKSIEHILVPVDFGKAANHALTLAMQLASVMNARITLLHVVQTPSMPGTHTSVGIAQYLDEVEAQARESLAEYAQRVKAAGMTCDAVTELASPFQCIIDYAAAQQVDLIVMGTHGHTGLQHVFLGSVAERVVRMASCPVLVTHGQNQDDASADGEGGSGG
jgi:nucleotide-binding universal stress UspA family protein